MKNLKLIPLLVLLIALFLFISCQTKEVEVTREVEKEVEVEVTRIVTEKETVVEKETVIEEVEVEVEVPVEVTREVTVEVEVPVEVEPPFEVPFEVLWASSGHADAEAEAFRHWDEDDPPVVASACAKCHSTPGYLDFIGADGTEAGVIDNAETPIGTTVECEACHNDVTLTMDSVVMPSGIELTGLGREARCIQCHQGRHSTVSVNAGLEEAGVTDNDEVSEEVGFSNIHYYAAAATKYGTLAKGGYEYEGKVYDANFAHVEEYDACHECHDPHTLEVRVEECAACHTGVASVEDLMDVRMPSSQVDYDGDGDIEEGVYYELMGLQEALYGAMQAYAADVAGTAIVYDAHSYPYFFADVNANGEVDEDDGRYSTWTARLAKAAYNYQVSQKDPGAYAHGGKYIIQLLYDSIEDLDADLVAGLTRIDHGHFAGSEEAFRHWDEDGEVSASCAKCHSAEGLPFFLENGVQIAAELSNGFQCTTCHDDLMTWTRYEVTEVEFPSGAVIDSGDPNMNLCMNCHQGRASTASVDGRIAGAGVGDDEVSDALGFVNVHYFAAGATRFGTEAQGAYQYEGKEYVGLFPHVGNLSGCTDCHSTHALEVKAEMCSGCHPSVASADDLDTIRIDPMDYDGDGDLEEGIAGEIETMQEALYAAMQDYATNTVGTGIVYDSHSYPYFFDEEGGRYSTWTPRLLRAAYNYQYVAKDPGSFAHNPKYIIQVLYDGLEDLGALGAGMARP
jgi:hypothetical protein